MGHELQHLGENRFLGFAVLLNEAGGSASTGYRLRGRGRGPHLAVFGPAALVDAVQERLVGIPSLPDIHGVLSLRRCEDDTASVPDWLSVVYDDVLELTQSDPDLEAAAEWASNQVLHRCALLGMLEEHGSEDPCPVV